MQEVQNPEEWLSGVKSLSPQARERLERSSIDQAIQSFQKMVEARKPKTPQSRPTGVLPRIVILVILFGGVRGCLEAVRRSGGPPDAPQRQYQLPPPPVLTPRELPNQAAVEKLKKTQDDMKVWLEMWTKEQKSGKNGVLPSTSAPTTK